MHDLNTDVPLKNWKWDILRVKYQVNLLTLDNSLILQIILLVGSKNQVYLTYLKK